MSAMKSSAFIISFLELTESAVAAGSIFLKNFQSMFLNDDSTHAVPVVVEDEPVQVQVSVNLDDYGAGPATGSLIYANGTFYDQGPKLGVQYFVSLWNEFAGSPNDPDFLSYAMPPQLAHVNLTGLV